MTKELEPCPFCGGKATVEPFNDENWFASCNECDATIEDFPNRSEAAKAWNTRYKRTCRLIMRDGSPACSECLAEQDYEAKFCDQCGAEVAYG